MATGRSGAERCGNLAEGCIGRTGASVVTRTVIAIHPHDVGSGRAGAVDAETGGALRVLGARPAAALGAVAHRRVAAAVVALDARVATLEAPDFRHADRR